VLIEIEPEKRREYVMPEIARDYETRRTNITNRVQQLVESCEIKTLRDRKGPGARRIVEVGYHSLMLRNFNPHGGKRFYRTATTPARCSAVRENGKVAAFGRLTCAMRLFPCARRGMFRFPLCKG
jgi:hypothetical protein